MSTPSNPAHRNPWSANLRVFQGRGLLATPVSFDEQQFRERCSKFLVPSGKHAMSPERLGQELARRNSPFWVTGTEWIKDEHDRYTVVDGDPVEQMGRLVDLALGVTGAANAVLEEGATGVFVIGRRTSPIGRLVRSQLERIQPAHDMPTFCELAMDRQRPELEDDIPGRDALWAAEARLASSLQQRVALDTDPTKLVVIEDTIERARTLGRVCSLLRATYSDTVDITYVGALSGLNPWEEAAPYDEDFGFIVDGTVNTPIPSPMESLDHLVPRTLTQADVERADPRSRPALELALAQHDAVERELAMFDDALSACLTISLPDLTEVAPTPPPPIWRTRSARPDRGSEGRGLVIETPLPGPSPTIPPPSTPTP